MIRSELSIVIDAPPENVFPAIAKPEHVMEDIPNCSIWCPGSTMRFTVRVGVA